MKIILLQDEKKLGKKGDIIEASEGYARNYILPKKIGVEATPKNMNDLKLQKANEDKRAMELLDAAKALAAQLEGRQVVGKIKAAGPLAPSLQRILRRLLWHSIIWRSTKRRFSCRTA